jgi:voltage-gated potassium channel
MRQALQKPALRVRLYREIAPEASPDGRLSLFNHVVVWVILLSVLVAILSTEHTLVEAWPGSFFWANLVFGALFTVEYLLRVWTAGEDPAYRGALGRLRYMRSPLALVDLIVLVPFYLAGFWGELFILRLLRVLRILALLRLGRFSRALRAIGGDTHHRPRRPMPPGAQLKTADSLRWGRVTDWLNSRAYSPGLA